MEEYMVRKGISTFYGYAHRLNSRVGCIFLGQSFAGKSF